MSTLTLKCKVNEETLIGEDIIIKIAKIKSFKSVKLQIIAPESVNIQRDDVIKRFFEANGYKYKGLHLGRKMWKKVSPVLDSEGKVIEGRLHEIGELLNTVEVMEEIKSEERRLESLRKYGFIE